jgi:hypothetical protein
MSWAHAWEFVVHHWGNLASVLGLAVSVATLAVASKAREAAEAARAVVWLRAQETANVASLSLARWPLELSADSKDNLLRSQQLANSIASVALRVAGAAPTAPDIERISQAQGRVGQLLAAELGESLRRSEGGQ